MDKPDGFNPDKVDAETGEKSKDVSGLKKSFEKRLETNLESEEGGLPTSVEQEKVPIATNYPHSQVNESDIVVKDDDKIIGSASNFTLEDGVVYCDIEIKGTYFEENTTIVPVTDMEGIQYLIPTPVPVEESLQGNLAHNDTVSN